MVEVNVTHDKVLLEVQGLHKLWALKSRLEIPLEHIKDVSADPHPAMGWFQGMKIAGTDVPNFFRAGLFWQEGNRVFWDVRHADKTVVLELEDESCAKLIVEVHDTEAVVGQIREALTAHRALRAAAEQELAQYLDGAVPTTPSAPAPATEQQASAQTRL